MFTCGCSLLSYEAFDKDAKVKPLSLLYLLESACGVAFWKPYRNNCKYQTLLDLGTVMENHAPFVLGANFTLDKSFHSLDVPKYPLHVIVKLKYLGKSSKTVSYQLYNSNTGTMYASSEATDILISSASRKPVSYPDWWLHKYGDLETAEKAHLLQEPISVSQPLESKIKVSFSDIDFYHHTHWNVYMKFCYDSLNEHVITKSYKHIQQENLNSGVESCNMIFKKESNLGDILTIQSWESSFKPNTLLFNVLKEEELCMHCSITFHPRNE